MLVDDSRDEGFAHTVVGKLHDAAGSLTGNTPTKACGNADRSAGEARSVFGQAVDEVRNLIDDQPFVAMLSALGLGAVVGFLSTRR